MDIYGTIGPSCTDPEILEQMFRAGMTGMRINLSHTTLIESSDKIRMIQKAAAHAGTKTELLIDLQGPELRIGKLNHPLSIEEGQRVRLGDGGIPVPASVLSAIRPHDELLLDDGKLLLRADGDNEVCVIRGGLLESRKSIAIVGRSIDAPALTQQDRENIRRASDVGVSAVMQPFVRSREDLIEVRQALDDCGSRDIRLFAKIENLAGIHNLTEFFGYADEIVIARGDLGNAVPLWTLPAVQKEIAEKCRAAKVPFMVVTQMLASMEQRPVPTRAEVSDIFNAVLDGAGSVMVTAETAIGAYPVEAIRYMANTVRAALEYLERAGN